MKKKISRKLKLPLLMAGFISLSALSLPAAAIFGVGDTVYVINCYSQVDMKSNVPTANCASEGSVAAVYTYLATGQPALGLGMAGANEGLIAQVKNLNSGGAHSVENQRQQTPNDDLAARYRDLQKKYLEAVENKTRPVSASACREATIGGGLGGGGSGGASGAGGDKIADDMETEVLTPKSELSNIADHLTSDNAKNYCTEEDVANKIPSCTAVGSLAGKNLSPWVFIKGAVPKGEKSNYSIDFKKGDPQYEALLDHMRITRPMAAPALAEGAKNSPPGKIYLAQQKRYNSRVMVVLHGMSTVAALSAKMPANDPYVKNVWQNAEVTQDYKDIYGNSQVKPDRPSERELMQFMVHRQFGTRLSAFDAKADELELARRQVEIAKLNSYLLLKLNTQQEWTNILLSNILSNDIDPVNREDILRKANAASTSGGSVGSGD